MKLIIVALALLFIANSIPGAASRRVLINGILLAVQWPFSYCSNPKNSPCKVPVSPNNKFTIHGLWPLRQDGRPADGSRQGQDDCGDRNYFDDRQLLPQIRSNLEVSWPSLSNQDDMGLWRWEWNKHGRCSSIREDRQAVYFNKALALYQMRGANLVKSLQQSTGLTRGGSIAIATIQQRSISRASPTGGTVRIGVLKCSLARDGSTWMLEDIRWCVDSNAAHFMDCPLGLRDSPECRNVIDLHLPNRRIQPLL